MLKDSNRHFCGHFIDIWQRGSMDSGNDVCLSIKVNRVGDGVWERVRFGMT